MAKLTVPACLEKTLSLGDGSSGPSLSEALQFDQDSVPNLYSCRGDEFCFSFQEHGVAYHEKEASGYLAEVTLRAQGGSPGFSLRHDPTPVEKWGINFAGTVWVKHDGGEERVVYLPGTRTYDPAGITGDPHASERIGPSCSRAQAGISVCGLVAALKGAELNQIKSLQEKLRPLILRYHGRECLFDWMRLQLEEAIYLNQEVTPYPEYVKMQVRSGKLELGEGRQHTRDYLEAYNRGDAHPPVHYYKKVAAKDKAEELFSPADLQKFKKIIQS